MKKLLALKIAYYRNVLKSESRTMQNVPAITGHLSPELAQIFLEGLPEPIRAALEMRAKTMNYPVWAVVEMAICQGLATRSQAT